jgi:outer membrane protein TolC
VVTARADERAATASVTAARGGYLPQVDLFGQLTSFDEGFFPNATTRSLVGFRVTVPIWNNAQREVQLSRVLTSRNVAQAALDDTQRGVRRDVIEAYENYNTARASTALAARAVLVARENLRVQQERYRVGSTTIIDLIAAQVGLTEAEAGLAEARNGVRLALVGLEAVLGRRLFM